MNINNLSSFDTKNVNDMSYMFAYCYNLNNLDLSSFDTKNVKDMSWMFYDCSNLTNLDVNQSSFKIIDDDDVFYGCDKLNMKFKK